MTRYRASVTYTVEVVDQAAVSAAGAAAWRAADGGWAVKVEEDGRVVEATAEEAAAARPDAEASIALALGQQGYPSVPGVQFHTMSVDVVTAAPEKE
ncbi:hypothetical protein [Blastococcus sp. DSM 46786]|uniref:hypothetical protein n=1 Tax=Blastococcus sp. DSM 46786 TaxID=1798227 RepID=UPI0011136C6A|nr:hypothetical protein [Blastococcus sp. DSM 46786]